MKVLLLGATGLLGHVIKDAFEARGSNIVGVAHNKADYEFDLLDTVKLEKCILNEKPDVIINAAAMVNLTMCDKYPLQAYAINTHLVSDVLNASRKIKSYFIQISTDHYFINDGNQKHDENAQVHLLNEYAITKYLGECISTTYEDALVIRTNFVGTGRSGFLEWVLGAFARNEKMTLFDDFYTSSIAVTQLADILFDIVQCHPTGVLNVASSEVRSKKDFILGMAECLGIRDFNYDVGSIKKFAGVSRANTLGLSTVKVENLLGYSMPDFYAVLNCLMQEVKRNEV